MKAQLLRRLINLEMREQATQGPWKKPFPAWLIAEWQKRDVPIDDNGIFDGARFKAAAVENVAL